MARRIGKVKAIADLAVWQKRVVERNALVKIIDKLVAEPALGPPVWGAIETGLINSVSSEQADSHLKVYFKEKVGKVGRLPVDWIASWLVANSPLTPKQVDNIDGHDKEALLNLFYLATGTAPLTPVPDCCRHRETCSRVFTARYVQLGRRLEQWAVNVNLFGVVDWYQGGAYRFRFDEEGKLVRVVHISGTEADLPAHIHVTSAYTLKDPWLDMGACFSYGGSTVMIGAFFVPGAGPHKDALCKKAIVLKEMATTVMEEMKKHDEEARAGAGQAFLSQHDEQVAEKRKVALQAARDKLKEAQNNRRNLRMAGFGPQVDDSQQALTMGEAPHPATF